MTRICIVALIGLPAAGKSTLCQRILKMTELPFNVAHFCFDTFLPFCTESIPDIDYRVERSKILALLQILVDALKVKASVFDNEMLRKIQITNVNAEDYVILFDDNNYYTSMRYKVYQLCKANQLYFGQIYIPIDISRALQRNAERNPDAQVPTYIVTQMAERLELPSVQYNSWEQQTLYLKLDDNSCAIANFIDFIVKCFAHRIDVTEVTAVDETNDHTISPLHYLDVQLRRRIKIILDAESSKEVKKQKAPFLNNKRKEILCSFSKSTAVKTINLEELNELCKLLN